MKKATSKTKKGLVLFSLILWNIQVFPIAVFADTTPTVGMKEGEKTFSISPGDVVAITIYPAEEYSREVTVQPDGKIELALIGAVLVKGLTSKELQDLLQEKYSKFVASPRITVNVRHFAGRRVAVIGEIRNPGFYEYREGMKLLELVSLAGGLSDIAGTTRVRILREQTGPEQSLRVNFKVVLDGETDRDVQLQPGDTVFIPKQRLASGATWLTGNILPWLTLLTAVTTIVILSKQK